MRARLGREQGGGDFLSGGFLILRRKQKEGLALRRSGSGQELFSVWGRRWGFRSPTCLALSTFEEPSLPVLTCLCPGASPEKQPQLTPRPFRPGRLHAPGCLMPCLGFPFGLCPRASGMAQGPLGPLHLVMCSPAQPWV